MKASAKSEITPIEGFTDIDWPIGSFSMLFEYEGRKIPFTVVGPSEEEEEALAQALAEFCWKPRRLSRAP